jgi:hypothetical protein
MKTRLSLAGVALIATAGLTGCGGLGLACTAIGWYEGATLHIAIPAASGTTPKEGRYHVEVDAEGETLALDIDWSPSSSSCDACSASGQRVTLEQVSVGAGTIDVVVGHVDGEAGPAQIHVRLSDGTSTWNADVAPRYRTTEPNGDGCGEAHTARVDVTPS